MEATIPHFESRQFAAQPLDGVVILAGTVVYRVSRALPGNRQDDSGERWSIGDSYI